VKAHRYNSPEQWMADVGLLLRNCRTFNKPDTEIVACAARLEAFVRARAAQAFGVAIPLPSTLPTPSLAGEATRVGTVAAVV